MGATPVMGQLRNGSGTIYAGVRVYVYAGGTSTPSTIYTDAGLSTEDTNPSIGDAQGVFKFFIDDAGAATYKIVVKTSDDSTTIYSRDNIDPTEGVILTLFNLGAEDDVIPYLDDIATVAANIDDIQDAEANALAAAASATDAETAATTILSVQDAIARNSTIRVDENFMVDGWVSCAVDVSGNVQSGVLADGTIPVSELDSRTQTLIESAAIGQENFMVDGWLIADQNIDGDIIRGTRIGGVSVGYGDTEQDVVGDYETYTRAGRNSGASVRHVRKVEQTGRTASPNEDGYAKLYRPLTAGPYSAEFIAEEASGHIKVLRNGSQDDLYFRTSSLLGGASKIYYFIVIGQSLSLGWKDLVRDGTATGPTPIIHSWDPVYPLTRGTRGAGMWDSSATDGVPRGPRVMQFAPTNANKNEALDSGQIARIVDLHESTHGDSAQFYDTICSSFAHTFLSQECEIDTQCMMSVIGTGGTAIADFEKGAAGSQIYANVKLAMEAMFDYADSIGVDCEVHYLWMQGTADNTAGTTAADYKTALTGIGTDLNTDTLAKAATYAGTAQTEAVLMVQQNLRMDSGYVGMASLAQADLMVAGTVYGMSSTQFKPGSNGAVHLIPATYMPWGSGAAQGMAQRLRNGSSEYPVHVTFSSKSGDQAEWTLTGGTGSGYTFDTTTIPNHADGWYGHQASDGSGALTVTDMTISGTTLTVTYNRTISGTLDWSFGAHHNGATGETLMPNVNAARNNIRDGSARTCPFTGQITSGWAITQEGSD